MTFLLDRQRKSRRVWNLSGFCPVWQIFVKGDAECAAFAVALCMTQPQRWAKGAALALAALMGFSRLYVGVHFPSDVLAGAVIGSLCGLLAGWMVPRFLAWVRSRRSGRTPPQMP